jgi:hypothetical protein
VVEGKKSRLDELYCSILEEQKEVVNCWKSYANKTNKENILKQIYK